MGKSGRDPFNDDISWVHSENKKEWLVAKCDMFVSHTDAPKGMSAEQMAAKSITACVSDFASKGVRPRYGLISLGLSKNRADSEFVNGLARGFRKASLRYGIRVLAGDTGVVSEGVTINCTLFGSADVIVKRNGASAGDLVGVTGRFGLQAAGLLLLSGKAKTRDFEFRKRAVSSVLEPVAQLLTGIRIASHLSSSIDSSDGLAISLYYLAESSGVTIELEQLPFAKGVLEFAQENSIDPSELVLFGGEEYEIVCTYPIRSRKFLERKKGGVTNIGRVSRVERPNEATPCVLLNGRTIARKGWVHFRSD
jgi:thiamine-monophosphate kinase